MTPNEIAPETSHEVRSVTGPVRPAAQPGAGLLRAPLALACGAALTAVALTLHPSGGTADGAFVREVAAHPDRWLSGHLAMGLGGVLLAFGLSAVSRLEHRRGARAVAVGTGIAAAGGVLSALGDVAHGAVAYALVDPVDAEKSLAIQTDFFESPAVLALSTGGLLLPIGILILGVALLSSGGVARWVAALLVVSPVAIQLGFATPVPAAVGVVPFVVGMAALARQAARS